MRGRIGGERDERSSEGIDRETEPPMRHANERKPLLDGSEGARYHELGIGDLPLDPAVISEIEDGHADVVSSCGDEAGKENLEAEDGREDEFATEGARHPCLLDFPAPGGLSHDAIQDGSAGEGSIRFDDRYGSNLVDGITKARFRAPPDDGVAIGIPISRRRRADEARHHRNPPAIDERPESVVKAMIRLQWRRQQVLGPDDHVGWIGRSGESQRGLGGDLVENDALEGGVPAVTPGRVGLNEEKRPRLPSRIGSQRLRQRKTDEREEDPGSTETESDREGSGPGIVESREGDVHRKQQRRETGYAGDDRELGGTRHGDLRVTEEKHGEAPARIAHPEFPGAEDHGG